MRDSLERSDIVFEFLAIMRSAPILPLLLRPAQHLLVRAAVDLTLSAGHVKKPNLLCGDRLNTWIASGVGCNRTLQPFFAK